MKGPAYKIITERLAIKCLEPKDAPNLKNAIDESIDHLKVWLPWTKYEPETVERKLERIRENRSFFDSDKKYEYGIFLNDESILIGMIALMKRIGDDALEIGYWLHKDFVKKGYMIEAVKAIIKVAFEVNEVSRVEIHCDPNNINSRNIPHRLGLTHEATVRKNELDDNGNHKKKMIWVIFKDEYESSNLKINEIRALNILDQDIL